MAIVQIVDASDGSVIPTPPRVSSDGDDPVASSVTILVCDTGQFIDPDYEELTLMPAPPQPEFERLVTEERDDTLSQVGDVALNPASGKLLKYSDDYYLELFAKGQMAPDTVQVGESAEELINRFFRGGPDDW